MMKMMTMKYSLYHDVLKRHTKLWLNPGSSHSPCNLFALDTQLDDLLNTELRPAGTEADSLKRRKRVTEKQITILLTNPTKMRQLSTVRQCSVSEIALTHCIRSAPAQRHAQLADTSQGSCSFFDAASLQ